jgi:hypothetical protein
VEFNVVLNGTSAKDPADLKALADFQRQVARLQRAVSGTLEASQALAGRLGQVRRALDHDPPAERKWHDVVRALQRRNAAILRALRGDLVLRRRYENTPPSIAERVRAIVRDERFALAPPTATHRQQYEIASAELARELAKLRTLIHKDLRELEKALDLSGAPWTPGRLPEWKGK